MNLCIFEGYLTRDPELRHVPGSDGTLVGVVSFSIGIKNRRTNKTSFPNFEAWGQTAEAIAKWFKKGYLIQVYSEHITDSWEDKTTGEKRSRDKFRVNNFEFPPINKGRNQDEEAPDAGESETETPDAGEKIEEVEAPETPKSTPVPVRKGGPNVRKPRPKTEPEDDEDIPF